MSDSTGRVADATGNWVDSLAPSYTRPYLRLARLDRPIGSWLLLMPCWWSVGLAGMHNDRFPSLWHIVLFFIGAFAMRGAGCTWNDLVDRDLDGRVERTRSRPIPSGQVTVAQATMFMVALALVGFLVLIQFNRFTVATGIASLLVVVIYPFMKRITYWPQIFLGLAFSWGALMGWPATFGRLDWPAIVLYAGSILWVIGYDTIYAHQDRDDDLLIGLRWLTDDVALEGDPLLNLAEAYLEKSSYSPVQHDLRKPKEKMLLERIKNSHASAAIIAAAKMCEPGLDEQVAYVKALDAEGIPYFVSEFEESMTSFDHLQIQLETFVENLLFA